MQEAILISITGMDRPGITASVTQVLAEFGVNVLDIGQSVIHDALSLGMPAFTLLADPMLIIFAANVYEPNCQIQFVNDF